LVWFLHSDSPFLGKRKLLLAYQGFELGSRYFLGFSTIYRAFPARIPAPVKLESDLRAIAARHAPKALIAVAGILVVVGAVSLWQSSRYARQQAILHLRGSIVQEIERGNWPDAERNATALLSFTPSDPSALQWMKQVQDGSKATRLAELRKAIPEALASGQWTEAQSKLRDIAQIDPTDSGIAEWQEDAQNGLLHATEISDLRSGISASIQGRNWPAAERDVSRLLAFLPRDQQASRWQELLHQGKREELLAAEKVNREQRVAELHKTTLDAIGNRNWDLAERDLADLAALAPKDSQISELRSQLNQGRNAQLQAEQEARERERAATQAERRQAEEQAAREAQARAAEERAARESEAKAAEERAARESEAKAAAEKGLTFSDIAHMHRAGACGGTLTINSLGLAFSSSEHSISLQKSEIRSVSECNATFYANFDINRVKSVCLKTSSGNFNFTNSNAEILQAIRTYWGM
jgi:hypothetical protein